MAEAFLEKYSPSRPAEEKPCIIEVLAGGAVNLATPAPLPTPVWVVLTIICKKDEHNPLVRPKR
jgi:hypothetical protein